MHIAPQVTICRRLVVDVAYAGVVVVEYVDAVVVVVVA